METSSLIAVAGTDVGMDDIDVLALPGMTDENIDMKISTNMYVHVKLRN